MLLSTKMQWLLNINNNTHIGVAPIGARGGPGPPVFFIHESVDIFLSD